MPFLGVAGFFAFEQSWFKLTGDYPFPSRGRGSDLGPVLATAAAFLTLGGLCSVLSLLRRERCWGIGLLGLLFNLAPFAAAGGYMLL
jgi:hypothetical protein